MPQPREAPAISKPQVQDVSHATVLEIEERARETYTISEAVYHVSSILELQQYGKPIEILRRVNKFGLLASDIAVCAESCRFDAVFYRAMALMEAKVVEGGDQKTRAANAVRRARIETKAEYEARNAAKRTDLERRDMKQYLRTGSLKR